jgi:aspartate 1-decarboxylase
MLRTYLLSKIHRATVTECNLNYNGSITIDKALLEASGMKEFEKVDIFNITNGERFSTYIIEGKKWLGDICINGAGARLAQPGDKIIIVNYGMSSSLEDKIVPTIIHVDDTNHICKTTLEDHE